MSTPTPTPENYQGTSTSVPAAPVPAPAEGSTRAAGQPLVSMSVLQWAVRDATSTELVSDEQVAHVTNACISLMALEAWKLQERTDWMVEHAGDPGVAQLEQVLDGPPIDPKWEDVAIWLSRAAGGKGPNWVHGTAIATGGNGRPVTSPSSPTVQ